MTETRDDWATVDTAAMKLGKNRATIYRYLTDAGPKIRTMRPGATTFVHLPTLRAFEATRRPGRPRNT